MLFEPFFLNCKEHFFFGEEYIFLAFCEILSFFAHLVGTPGDSTFVTTEEFFAYLDRQWQELDMDQEQKRLYRKNPNQSLNKSSNSAVSHKLKNDRPSSLACGESTLALNFPGLSFIDSDSIDNGHAKLWLTVPESGSGSSVFHSKKLRFWAFVGFIAPMKMAF